MRWPKNVSLSGADVDTLARRHLWAKGLDYLHGTGHGVGYYQGVHEGPVGISKFNKTVFSCESALVGGGIFDNWYMIVVLVVAILTSKCSYYLVVIISIVLISFCWRFKLQDNKEKEKKAEK